MSGLVSKNLVAFVKSFEGFSPTVYLDCVGIKTLGYGMTGDLIKGLNYVTEAQASELLESLLNSNYAQPIKNDLDNKGVTLNQNEFDALVSMAYNIGVGGLLGSTLYKFVARGIKDKTIITNNFQTWSIAGGKRVEGLYRRRTEEAQMFFRTDNILQTIKIEEVLKVKNLVVVSNSTDKRAGEYLADFLQCPIIDGSLPFDYSVVENVYGVGGAPITNGVPGWSGYVKIILTGSGRYDTCQKVLDFIKSKSA